MLYSKRILQSLGRVSLKSVPHSSPVMWEATFEYFEPISSLSFIQFNPCTSSHYRTTYIMRSPAVCTMNARPTRRLISRVTRGGFRAGSDGTDVFILSS